MMGGGGRRRRRRKKTELNEDPKETLILVEKGRSLIKSMTVSSRDG